MGHSKGGALRLTKDGDFYIARVYANVHGRRIPLRTVHGVQLGTPEGTQEIIEALDEVKKLFPNPRK